MARPDCWVTVFVMMMGFLNPSEAFFKTANAPASPENANPDQRRGV
jgi:hypothetical protein